MKKIITAFALTLCAIADAFGQAPPPVPSLPDSSRLTQYSISGSTCACSVGFQLYGDGTDVDNWIQVFIGTQQVLSTDPTFGWVLTSPTGPIGSIARPVVDGLLTFSSAQTGTITIVGAQRPRRLSEFQENRGVPARDHNQVLNTLFAEQRESWDRLNRTIRGQPGEVLNLLPAAASRANGVLAFDATGLKPTIISVPTAGTLPTLAQFHFFIGNASGFAADAALTGDGTYGASGLVVTKTNGVAFAPSATTDTTNATNIASGTLNTVRLPSPFTSGTASGNTAKFATTTGTLISGDCVKIDASGNFIDFGGVCGGSALGAITVQNCSSGLTCDGAPHTYTPTGGTIRDHIRMCGGGGGGGAVVTNNGTNGADSSFGAWTAIHGNGGAAAGATGATGGTGGVNGIGTLVLRVPGKPSSPGATGVTSGGDSLQGFGGQTPSVAAGPNGTGFGSGGAGGSGGGFGSGGAGAECVEFWVASPTSVSYTAGANGTGGAAGTHAGGNGTGGGLEIEEYPF